MNLSRRSRLLRKMPPLVDSAPYNQSTMATFTPAPLADVGDELVAQISQNKLFLISIGYMYVLGEP